MEEATVSLTAAKEICGDAALDIVLSEPDGVFAFKEKTELALKAFLGIGIDIFFT